MDNFKLDNFQRSYPDKSFPTVEVVGEEVADALRSKVAVRLGRGASRSGTDLVRDIAAEAEPLPDEDARGRFDLLGVLDGLGLQYSEHVFLNWGQFGELDRIRLRDLGEYFGDIWYPDSDDLDIVDADCNWILSVRHDGVVSILRT